LGGVGGTTCEPGAKCANLTNYGTIGNDGVPPEGYQYGVHGTDLPASPSQLTWKAGSIVEVSWSPLIANHGGGYQYRLCPKSSTPTEDCFQKMPLTPVGNVQWIQYYGNRDYSRTAIEAIRVTEGVKPAGSTWTRDPFPPCLGISGGEATHPCDEAMFEPPKPMPKHWYGYGLSRCQIASEFGSVDSACNQTKWYGIQDFHNFGIIDRVKVPVVPKGEYLLSWRWDVEQSPQVWSNCADVTIDEADTAAQPSANYGDGGSGAQEIEQLKLELAKARKQSKDDDKALSGGAVAGIVVLAVAVIVLIVGIIILVQRSRARHVQSTGAVHEDL